MRGEAEVNRRNQSL